MTTVPNVLVVTGDVLGERMAGPAIRAFEIAKALSEVVTVRLISTSASTLFHSGFTIMKADGKDIRQHEDWADVIVFQGHFLASHPWLVSSKKIIVADIYDPMHLEQLEQSKDLEDNDRIENIAGVVRVLNEQMERADFMVCASEKQRDFWLGQLAALGRINSAVYDKDPGLRSLLDVVPFGVDSTPPVQKTHGIKGTVPGISSTDKVVIWGGGIYNWFDPITLIEAISALSTRRPDIRLYFLGVKHPNPDVPAMRMALKAQRLAEDLGLLDRFVFFNEGWVPYDARADYLLDADLGVSIHLDHIETSYSFRTRILDYLWASLPIVSTAGDTFASLITEHRLGRVVPPQNVRALENALEELLYDETEMRHTSERVAQFAHTMIWPKVLAPLIRFCVEPSRAADLIAGIEPANHYYVDQLAERIRGLENSRSWRLTAPLRALVRGISHTLARLGR